MAYSDGRRRGVMDSNEDNSTDGASIVWSDQPTAGSLQLNEPIQKPVSSLKSHFEKISTNEPSHQSMPSRSTANEYQRSVLERHEPRRVLRASLHLQPGSSPLQETGYRTISQPLKETGLLSPQPRRPGSSASPQRPVSMTSLSTPQSLPLVTASVPQFASMYPNASDITQSSFPAVPKQLSQQPTMPAGLPTKVPLSTRSASAEPTQTQSRRYVNGLHVPPGPFDEKQSDGTKRVDQSVPKLPSRAGSSSIRISEVAKRPIPPPINRADKPKVLIQAPVVGVEHRLQPSVSNPIERTSPFSTPSSSDEDKSHGLCHDGIGGAQKRKPKGPLADSECTNSSSHDEFAQNETGLPPGLRGAGASLFILGRDRRTKINDDRPGLPPRKQQVFSDKGGKNALPRSVEVVRDPPSSDPHSAKSSGFSNRSIQCASNTILTHPTPLTRNRVPSDSHVLEDQAPAAYHSKAENGGVLTSGFDANASNTVSFPDLSNVNRSPPHCSAGARAIDVGYDTRLIDLCGRHLCTAGHVTKIWDAITGELLASFSQAEKDVRVTALAFRSAASASDEGSRLWLGTNYGEIQEVDVPSQGLVRVKPGAHERREVLKILRHQNTMWSLDDGGKLCVWQADELGLPNLQRTPLYFRVPRGHSCSLIIQDTLWLASGREIRLFRPKMGDSAAFSVLHSPLGQPHLGPITSGSVIGGQTDRVYFGHADGKVSVYSNLDFSCLAVVNVNVYKINALVGAGFFLWAVYSTGMVCIYDTRTEPWTTKKEWVTHEGSPILSITVDRSSLWRTGILRIASIGSDNAVRFWDGTLENDWMGRSFS
ncbi:MAG: hypothetical protein Q9164_005351 [Protoblastenia rupestris]